MVSGKGTRDLAGPKGSTTEEFIQSVAKYLDNKDPINMIPDFVPQAKPKALDTEKVRVLYEKLDKDKDGVINFQEFVDAVVLLNVQPKTLDEIHKTISIEQEEAETPEADQ